MSAQFAFRRNKTELVCERMLNTRLHWSRNEREQRARLAQIRQAKLWSLLTAPPSEPEIWAVGAASLPDVARIEK
jgi:hypothetical protein